MLCRYPAHRRRRELITSTIQPLSQMPAPYWRDSAERTRRLPTIPPPGLTLSPSSPRSAATFTFLTIDSSCQATTKPELVWELGHQVVLKRKASIDQGIPEGTSSPMASTTDHDRDINDKEFRATAEIPTESQIRITADEKEKGESVAQSAQQEPRDVERSQDDLPAEPPSEGQVQRVQSAGEDYSVLSVAQKRLIVMAASLASLFSPMETAIYCPYPIFKFIQTDS
jgi:hypothetical protein